ncbi:hypothetical protein [Pontibacter virosus]|uniref:Uncharacterized protein n=1 Tax=Pontibacter virosus TaxID=1765052 RepID=A0A2U1B3I6_9BACT|nr:hypothetical protein [Pontibacter virosus]PVY43256.1 hypothetical protein C8E01_102435 [Pontibacter virosus]
MKSLTQTQPAEMINTVFHYKHSPEESFDATALLNLVMESTSQPECIAKSLEDAHSLLLDMFLNGGFDAIYASNLLFTLRQLRNALLRGAKGVDLDV